MSRCILHVDANCFYASVAMFRAPELRGCALAVGGNENTRHGIVLAKNPQAKAAGVKTGEPLVQARRKCPSLVVVPPDYSDYLLFSRDIRSILLEYTDLMEPFGLDECWLDITGSLHLFGGVPFLVAEQLSERIKSELGITVSIGISWNKPFAKLGSDLDAGDGIVEYTHENYQETVWKRAVGDLINVGPATTRKLAAYNVRTIGDLAQCSDKYLDCRFGVVGRKLRTMAQGLDTTPVKAMRPEDMDVARTVKSVGNGLTAPHDITCAQDAKALLHQLCESVAHRMREFQVKGTVCGIGVRHADLGGYSRQRKLRMPTHITSEVMNAAWDILCENEPLNKEHPIRQLHVCMSGLVSQHESWQPDIFGSEEHRRHLERLDASIDDLRRRYGNHAVRRLSELADPAIKHLDIKGDNIIHPVSYWA